MATVVSLLNQKGGVGKTSTTHHLSATLAMLGRRILVVDNDPQSSLTQGIHGPSYLASLDPSQTIAAVYRGEAIPGQVINPTPFPGVDLLAGSPASAEFNVPWPHQAPWEHQATLRDFLGEVAGIYDLILIDNPPTLSLCSWASLAASDFLLIPLQCEDYGSQGVSPVLESLEAVRQTINPRIQLLGLLLTMYRPRAAIHQLYAGNLRGAFLGEVFEAVMPDALDFKEAVGARMPIARYKPKGASAKAVRAIAEELLSRIRAKTTHVEQGAA